MSIVTTNWTSEEQAFLDAYQAECDREVEAYKQQDNPGDPFGIFWTRNWDMERVEALGDEYKQFLDGWVHCKSGYSTVFIGGVFPITRLAEQQMKEHYQAKVLEYKLPEPPKDIQHDKVIKIKAWKHLGRDGKDHEAIPYQSVLLVGQIIIQTSLYGGEKEWKFVDGYKGMLLPIGLKTRGSRELKKEYEGKAIEIATKLSKLMDWEEATNLPATGRTVLRDEITAIQLEYVKW